MKKRREWIKPQDPEVENEDQLMCFNSNVQNFLKITSNA